MGVGDREKDALAEEADVETMNLGAATEFCCKKQQVVDEMR